MSLKFSKCDLKRAKSTGALHQICERSLQDDFFYNAGISSMDEGNDKNSTNSQIEATVPILIEKICKLIGMVQKQQYKLKTLIEDLKIFHNINKNVIDSINDSAEILEEIKCMSEFINDLKKVKPQSPEKGLRTTVELNHQQRFDSEVKHALSDISDFLQSESLKDRIASTAAESIRRAIDECIYETFPSAYLSVSEPNSSIIHNKLTEISDKPFKGLETEENLSPLWNLVRESTPTVYVSTKEIQTPLEGKETSFLKRDSKSFPKLPELIIPQLHTEFQNIEMRGTFYEPYSPTSPPQPMDPDESIIDHLMKSALINKRIKEGHVNESFEEALSSSNLSLVMAACRTADPAKVFNPCSLRQSVLLSLVQQLATDMVHETQLKCRYLEEALINLDVTQQATRAYLPLVVGEVRKHLSSFVRTYPNHVASRRISLIIMAADNLLK